MARQEGIILLTGPVGNLSFYKMKGRYFVRRKSGVSGERIKSEPAYVRTRENIAEFGRASLSAKLLRKAFASLIQRAADNRLSSRLTGAMLKVIKSDALNPRGERNVRNGRSTLLAGFQFNKSRALTNAFSAPFTASIDRATGAMVIDIPAFAPADMISTPRGATHFRLRAGGAAIDFEGNRYSAATCETAEIAMADTAQGSLKLSMRVSADSSRPMFLVFAIEFLQSVNGSYCPLSETSNAMAIVKVDDSPVHDVLPKAERVAVVKQVPVLAKKSMIGRKPVRFNGKLITNREQVDAAANDHHPLNPPSRIRNIRTRDG